MVPTLCPECAPEVAAARRAVKDLARLLPAGSPALVRAEARLAETLARIPAAA